VLETGAPLPEGAAGAPMSHARGQVTLPALMCPCCCTSETGPTTKVESVELLHAGWRVPLGSKMSALVEIHLGGPSAGFMYRCLGSIAERDGMCIYADPPLSTSTDTLRLSVVVPRAQTQREAEETITWCVEWIRHAVDIRDMELLLRAKS
jgi:hypothetical protein